MWSGAWNKAHFINLLVNKYLPSTVSRVLEWWSRGPGFNPNCGQFLTTRNRANNGKQLDFSYFEFKIRLIWLDFSFRKQKHRVLVFKLTNYWSASSQESYHHTKELTVNRRHKKCWSIIQSCMTISRKILLFKLIQHKIWKTRMKAGLN